MPESKIKTRIPIISANFRRGDRQMTAIALVKHLASYYKIETIGLFNIDDDEINCSPIALRMFI